MIKFQLIVLNLLCSLNKSRVDGQRTVESYKNQNLKMIHIRGYSVVSVWLLSGHKWREVI